ncbi:hypothetical protein GE061_012012 [Apolygus lucorum]|uniref:Uncharacterized protein n=1 Tax=Apolygus lucorum TaxID=248454 RepID=A0A8S9XR50_APOLU|nr:hypothetical protein GE061_012012 [Apolygus lucorum]
MVGEHPEGGRSLQVYQPVEEVPHSPPLPQSSQCLCPSNVSAPARLDYRISRYNNDCCDLTYSNHRTILVTLIAHWTESII